MKTPNDNKRPNSNSGSIGQMFRKRSRMIHVSCRVAMMPEPWNPEGPRVIPWIERPGRTLKLGNNKKKRMARQLRKSMRAAAVGTSRALRGKLPLAA